MIVQTLDRRYAVLRVLRSSETEEISVCQDLDEEGGRLYTLARFRDQKLNRYLLPMLTRQRDNPSFEDFAGLFSHNGDLYAKFRYTEAPLLADRLKEGGMSFPERLELAGNLLERMALLNMPEWLQFEALRDQNITADAALRVRFNYQLESMMACHNVDMGFICLRVEELLRSIFARELAIKGVPELEAYLAQLRQTVLNSYLDIYGGYDQVRQKLLGRAMAGPVKPRNWYFRLWDKIKGLKRFVKPVLAGIVLVAAFCYLVYTLLVPPVYKGKPVIFDQIGTVEVTLPTDPQEPTEEPTQTNAP